MDPRPESPDTVPTFDGGHGAPDYYIDAHRQWQRSMFALLLEVDESVQQDVEGVCREVIRAAYEFGKEVGRGDR